MHLLRTFLVVVVVLANLSPVLADPISSQAFNAPKPKLVLVLVVDQFRADYLTRFRTRFLPAKQKDGSVGGYSYLTSAGAYYPFAQYDVLQCMTGPGHAMILSGSYPYQMGIPLNGWYDHERKAPTYCVADPSKSLVGSTSGMGMSPHYFTGATLGDELKNAGYSSRVVTLALKDRAAIMLGGRRANLAFWFDLGAFRWVSSTYYLKDGKLPEWLTKLNASIEAKKGTPYVWESVEKKHTGLTTGMQFRYATEIGKKDILNYPYGLEVATEAAEKAIDAYELGRGKHTDVLALSFSNHDYLGHAYGPNTLEMEEMTLAEDRVISKFLNVIRKKIPGGLKDVVIVLTADHGIPPSTPWLSSVGFDSGKIKHQDLQDRMEARLREKFGKSSKGNWIVMNTDLNFFLNREVLTDLGASREKVEEEMKAELSGEKGVSRVFSRTDVEKRRLPPAMLERQILKSYLPDRSGDVIAIPAPFYTDDDSYPFSHITSYTYDRTVPLVIAGARFKPGVYGNPADIVDIAPTLAFVLGVLAPATSEGRVLHEALR